MHNENLQQPVIHRVPWGFWPGFPRLAADRTHLNHVAFAGVGWGKTYGGARWFIQRCIENFGSSSRKAAILAPTHRHLKRQHYPILRNALGKLNLHERRDYTFHKQDMVVEFKTGPWRDYQIFLVSMDTWQSLVAWEFDHAWWDEPGFGSVDAKDFLDQRVGRSPGVQLGQILFTGVVQLVNWYFDLFGEGADLMPTAHYNLEQWVDQVAPGWGGKELVRFRENRHNLVLHASSFENKLLRMAYFVRLWEAFGYKLSKFRAHVIGEAVAVNTDAVYPDFDEGEHTGDFQILLGNPRRVPSLDLSFDFNVGQMTSLVCLGYNGDEYALWENGYETMTTSDACREFIRAFPPRDWGHLHIRVFGDNAGYKRDTRQRLRDGDYAIIRNALSPHYREVTIHAPRYTVYQPTRVLSTNRLLAEKRLFIDKRCRKLIAGLRKTSWDSSTGKIRKGADDDHTHAPEALDYRIFVEYPPVDTPMVSSTRGNGRRRAA